MHLPLFCPLRLMRLAVAKGRKHFLNVFLWPRPHVKAVGGLTQMKWGPADCSATLGGHLGYSFSAVLSSGVQVQISEADVALKTVGRQRGVREPPGLGHSALHLALWQPISFQSSPPHQLDTFEM